ncbi:MAG: hypothetical protein UHK60_08975 [Acutalibacteraceae bacterium]|nr:hypothetical protein [Acutalibacteraceae bacterium]
MNNYYILYNEKSGLWEIWNSAYSYIEQYAVSESQAKELVKTLPANDNRLSIDNKFSQTVRSLLGKEK